MSLSGYSERAIGVHNFARENNFGPNTLLVGRYGTNINLPRITDETSLLTPDTMVYVTLSERIIDLIEESGIPIEQYQRRSWRLTNFVIMNAGLQPVFITNDSDGPKKVQCII